MMSVALGGGRQGATLRDIIATGDYINHAILTGPQIRRGLAKLVRAGFAQEKSGAFHLAGRAKSFHGRLQQKQKPVLRQLEEWESFLGVLPPPEPDPLLEETEWLYPAITDEAVKQAYDEYVAKVQTTRHKAQE